MKQLVRHTIPMLQTCFIWKLRLQPHGRRHKTKIGEMRIYWLRRCVGTHSCLSSPTMRPPASTSFSAVQSGLKLPVAHCAFKGCRWIGFTKDSIHEHVVRVHGAQMLAAEAEVYGKGVQYGSSPLLRKLHYTLNMHYHPFSWLAICGGRKLAIANSPASSNHEGCCLAFISPATVVRGFS